jgi:hypothetical protein
LTLIICFPPSIFDSKLVSTSDSKSFNLTTNDFLERHYSVLCQGILWYSHHFPMFFFDFILPLFFFSFKWLSWEWPSFLYPFFCVLGPPFTCFIFEEFVDPKSCLFCLNLCSILTSYI